MLNPLRRGTASIARPFLSTSTPLFRINPLHANRARQPILAFTKSPCLIRTLATSPTTLQYGSHAQAFQEEDVDTEPQSGAQIDQTAEDGPATKFKDLGDRVCQTLVRTITEDMGLETMTQVQSLTLSQSLAGHDILAQARTGTGKTLAFLIPLLQNIINVDPHLERRGGARINASSKDIRAIIISPTRELAEQIAVEAKKLTRNTGIVVQTGVGGSSKAAGLRNIKNNGCHVLVGTPGRLKDLLSDQYSSVRAPNLSALVLDEADRLLDQGFAPDIQEIQNLLPDRNRVDRQTLLYSATVPQEVMGIVRRTMKRDFQFVQTVQEGEAPTHERVVQKVVNVGGYENSMPALVELCQRELLQDDGKPFKAIVYFGATAEVSLAAAIMRNLKSPGMAQSDPLAEARIIEMHARLSQEQRTRAADAFRRARAAIMLSSDVTARGMDFPGVTHVLQVGLPPSAEQYVHRLGRTARAGQEGEGWLFINDLEAKEMTYKLKGLPKLQVDESLVTPKVDMSKEAQLPEHAARILTQVGEAAGGVPRKLKALAYVANLGVYSWVADKQMMIDTMNRRSKFGWGMPEPPKIGAGLAAKLGLKRVRGLQIGDEEHSASRYDDGPRYDQHGGGSRYGGGSRNDGGRYGGGSRYDGGSRELGRYGDRSKFDSRRGPERSDYDSADREDGGFRGGTRQRFPRHDRTDKQANRFPRGELPRGDQGQYRGHARSY